MKTEYYKIDMEIVRKTIKDKGFYYIKAEKLFGESFTGPKLYIVTDDHDFVAKNPTLADMVIMTVAEFEPIAKIHNDFIRVEDKERHRDTVDFESYEVQNLIFDEPIEQLTLQKAISTLDAIQRERLIRYYFYGQSFSEIAKCQNVSARAVSYSVKLAEEKIREFYCNSTENE